MKRKKSLTAGNAQRALLSVKRIQLEVHWTGQGERNPANISVNY